MKTKIVIISGPNLNLLGIRDYTNYGDITYKGLKELIKNTYPKINFQFYQSNHEGRLIDKIQSLIKKKNIKGVIINLGGYTHTSIALRDAIALIKTIKVEVHLSNIYEREEFRKISLVKDVVDYQIVGKKEQGYLEAIDLIIKDSGKQ